ncbi:hypothetical protein [Candidatus Protochlamydia naegleriophila]|nr:hypothetical protein [Candidatus Protochlamydia naegleriophila]
MYRTWQMAVLLAFSLLMTGCSPRSLEDFKEEGEGITRSLIQELQKIRSRDQLVASTGRLQRLFDELVLVAIAAREFHHTHQELEMIELTLTDHELSDRLRVELNRIYRFEGGRQIIEKCQEAALNRLDACEKRLCK